MFFRLAGFDVFFVEVVDDIRSARVNCRGEGAHKCGEQPGECETDKPGWEEFADDVRQDLLDVEVAAHFNNLFFEEYQPKDDDACNHKVSREEKDQ